MIDFNKDEIKELINEDFVYDLLADWGGEPQIFDFGIISSTICHNPPGVGSRKLYYYFNSNLFHCFTGCEEPSFDIFDIVIKLFEIQKNQRIDLHFSTSYDPQQITKPTKAIETKITATLWENGNAKSITTIVFE